MKFLQVTITLDSSLKDSVLRDSVVATAVDLEGANRSQRLSLEMMADCGGGVVVEAAGEVGSATLEARIVGLEDAEAREEEEVVLQVKVALKIHYLLHLKLKL